MNAFSLKMIRNEVGNFSAFWNCTEYKPIETQSGQKRTFLVLTKYGKTNFSQIGVRKLHPGLKCFCQIATSYYFFELKEKM